VSNNAKLLLFVFGTLLLTAVMMVACPAQREYVGPSTTATIVQKSEPVAPIDPKEPWRTEHYKLTIQFATAILQSGVATHAYDTAKIPETAFDMATEIMQQHDYIKRGEADKTPGQRNDWQPPARTGSKDFSNNGVIKEQVLRALDERK
jgi:hypothetical protein